MERNDLPDKVLTLAGAEKIIRSYPEIEDNLYDNRGNLEVDDLQIQYFVSEESETSTMPLLQTLTGIEVPSAEHSWNFQKSTVLESGDTYSTALDVQTGALVYVLEISGNQLSAIFG